MAQANVTRREEPTIGGAIWTKDDARQFRAGFLAPQVRRP
jgi:hypothetical protein